MRVKDMFKPRVALVLGGGGARGLSHLGVLALLEREGIRPDLIVGTSIGALIGGLYCIEGSSEKVYSLLAKFVSSPSFDKSYFQKVKALSVPPTQKPGFFKRLGRLITMGSFAFSTATKESYIPKETFSGNIDALISETAVESLDPKLAIVAADLKNGGEVIITSGSLRDAVKASVAIAGILPSTPIDGRVLIDGGYVNQVPVEAAFRLSADVVIAVDVSQDMPELADDKITGGASSMRAMMILAETARKFQLRFADVVISPEMGDLHWTDFENINEFMDKGASSAEQKTGEIKKAIARAKRRKIFWTLFGRKWKVDLKAGNYPH
jgi:NTE family protein